jgi:hypothetical protein
LVGEVGHVDLLEALTVASDDVTHGEVHHIRFYPLFQLRQKTTRTTNTEKDYVLNVDRNKIKRGIERPVTFSLWVC